MKYNGFNSEVCILCVIFVVGLLPVFSYGDWDVEYHDGNDIYCGVSNYGATLLDCKWLQFSGYKYIFGSGIWYGSILNDGDTCVTEGYNPSSGHTECVPGLFRQGSSAYNNPYVRVYIYPEDWPPNPDSFPMAPDTLYSCEDSWACFNDHDSAYHNSNDTHPIGIEIYQSGYADTSCANTIFFRYTIKNCTTYTITNSYIGICIDPYLENYNLISDKWYPDIPSLEPDSFYIDYLPYCYGSQPGIVGIYMLETPGNIGPTACMAFSLEIDPTWDYQRYLVLKGFDYITGDSVGFMPGPIGPGDIRVAYASGPFDINPGDTVHFAFATILAQNTTTLAWGANRARRFYYQNVSIEEEQPSKIPDNSLTTISSGILYIGIQDELTILDPLGRLLKNYKYPPKVIKLNFLPSGIYFAVLKKGDELSTKKFLLIR